MSRADWAPVLMYHRVAAEVPAHDPYRNFVKAEVFDAQLGWLRRRGFRGVTVSALADALARGESLPDRSVAITFDDGYRDNLEVAWPLLRRHGFTATVFVVSGSVGGSSEFDRPHGYPPAAMLSSAELRELHGAGVEIGSHTVTHPESLCALRSGSLQAELADSRAALEDIVGAPVTAFAYPHSQVDARVEAAVAAAGYRAACAGRGAAFRPLRLSRLETGVRRGLGIETQVRWRRLRWRLGRTAA